MPLFIRLPLFLMLLLLISGKAQAANWFALDDMNGQSGLTMEVNTELLRQAGPRRDVDVRVTYPGQRRHLSGAHFQSIVATVEFDCIARQPGLRDASFYSGVKGEGIVMVREPGWLEIDTDRAADLFPQKALDLMMRAACSRPTPAIQ